MMAMTSQHLDDLESAFLEAIEPGFSPRRHPNVQLRKPASKKIESRRSKVGSWWSNIKTNLVSKLICCAPSKALLDDDEIADLLASMEEPIKCEESTSLTDISFVLSEEKPISVTPVDYASDAATEVDESSDEEHDHKSNVLTRVGAAVIAVTKMQSLVDERKRRVAAELIQQRWRQKQQIEETVVPVALNPEVCDSQPEHKPSTEETEPVVTPVPSKRRRSRRTRKHRSHNKKSKTVEVMKPEVEAVAEPEPEVATLNVEVQSKKRSRTTTTASTIPAFDSRFRSHISLEEGEDDELVSFFGEEKIDQDFHLHDYHSMARCESIVPPVTAFRPTPIKSPVLQRAQTTVLIQQKTPVITPEIEEIELFDLNMSDDNSRMSEIRAKMAVVRHRLNLLRSRSSCSETEGPEDEPDILDWL